MNYLIIKRELFSKSSSSSNCSNNNNNYNNSSHYSYSNSNHEEYYPYQLGEIIDEQYLVIHIFLIFKIFIFIGN
jgi:hypothetical protein